MTDDIIRMAREAGFEEGWVEVCNVLPEIEELISLAKADEREACAITAAIHSQYPITTDYDRGYNAGRMSAAAAIRARSKA